MAIYRYLALAANGVEVSGNVTAAKRRHSAKAASPTFVTPPGIVAARSAVQP